ncbi:MAG: N-acetyltransferase family protein [Candidatus Limnocylindrales bacterium]
MTIRIEPMAHADWPDVHRIYAEGIATGNATLEREAPDRDHFDRSHRQDCRFVARAAEGGAALGWVALSAVSARRVYRGVAWESVYVSTDARGQGVGRALMEALIAASEEAGFWTLQAGVLAENGASLALHERVGFRPVGVQRRLGPDRSGRWRDVVLLERRSATVGLDSDPA